MSRTTTSNPFADLLLGKEPARRRHTLLVMLTLVPYSCSVLGIVHSYLLGYMSTRQAMVLTGLSLSAFLTFFALVRSGWSQRFADPVLALPHAICAVLIAMGAYASLGEIRANVIILVAQIIVLSMFRLRPREVLWLGITTVALLGGCILFVSIEDPVHYKAATGWGHFALSGSTLLALSLIGKWVSDIRMRIARQARELTEAIGTLQQMATTDMLTGTLNRRMLTELLDNEYRLWERTGAAFCVVLMDIDHFKQVNDRYGHAIGDLVLKRLVDDARPQLRQVDKLGRWGGEEFLLMLPRASMDSALIAAERLRTSFESQRFDEAPGLRVSLSAGIAVVRHGESLEHTIDRADAALYSAKQAGRNRCHLADELTGETADAEPSVPDQTEGASL